MPRKRTTRRTHPPPSPLEQFFSGLRDIVLDTVEDVAYDLRDALIEQGKVGGQGQGQSGKVPKDTHPRPEKRPRTGRNTTTVPVKAPTHYSTLGVSTDCPQEVIQAAYRALSRIYHPDVPKTGNEAKMKKINAAYEVLRDLEQRAEYDKLFRL